MATLIVLEGIILLPTYRHLEGLQLILGHSPVLASFVTHVGFWATRAEDDQRSKIKDQGSKITSSVAHDGFWATRVEGGPALQQ